MNKEVIYFYLTVMIILFFFCSMLLQEKPQQHKVKKLQVFHRVRLKTTRGKIRKYHLFQIIWYRISSSLIVFLDCLLWDVIRFTFVMFCFV